MNTGQAPPTKKQYGLHWRLMLRLYVANSTLLFCHEIDSACWREWELFHLPGGPDFFVIVHLPVIGAVLWGLVLIAQRHAWSRWFSVTLGATGLCGGLLHSWFLVQGDSRFTSLVSIALIVSFLTVSVVQIGVALNQPCSGPGPKYGLKNSPCVTESIPARTTAVTDTLPRGQ